jgi:hypothetical protein
MPSQIVEISVDIPDGYDYVDFRVPYPGDLYIVDGDVRERKCDASIGFPCPIVKKGWKWPEWLKAAYIAMDANGDWYAYNEIPERSTSVWFFENSYDHDEICFLGADLIRFDPPPCDDWQKSLRANPAYK